MSETQNSVGARAFSEKARSSSSLSRNKLSEKTPAKQFTGSLGEQKKEDPTRGCVVTVAFGTGLKKSARKGEPMS